MSEDLMQISIGSEVVINYTTDNKDERVRTINYLLENCPNFEYSGSVNGKTANFKIQVRVNAQLKNLLNFIYLKYN